MNLTPHTPSDTAVPATVRLPSAGPVVIALATYRRPADLARCLDSLVAEISRFHTRLRTGGEHLEVGIVVVDNDPEGSGRDVASTHGDVVRYLVEPTPGISAARNRALDAAAAARTLIFVDDDEEVTPGWLTNLFDAYCRWRPAAVAGRVVSEFGAPLDPWIEAGGFFRRRTLATGSAITTAATNNLLLDLDSVRRLGLRFDDSYGLTGGGDTDFTRRLVQQGAAMIWSDDAVVIDHVPAERSTREWVCRRARRTGNSEVVVALRLAVGPGARAAVRARAAARGLGRVTAGSAGRGVGRLTGSVGLHARSTKAVCRGRGMLAGASGRSVAEYTRSAERPVLRVLTSFPRPGARTNPYIRQLAGALDATDGISVMPFSWRGAVLGHYDVVHLHWPEILLRGGPSVKGKLRRALVMVLIARWALGRVGVVRTVHNHVPHEVQGRTNAALLRRLDAVVDVRVTLNAVDGVSGDDTSIPHGHYVDWYADTAKRSAVAGRIVFAGLVRQYKNVGELMEALADVP